MIVYTVLNWALGILFGIAAIGSLMVSPLASFLYLTASALLLPPIRHRVAFKTKRSISPASRALAVLVLILGTGMLADTGWGIGSMDLFIAGSIALALGTILLFDQIRKTRSATDTSGKALDDSDLTPKGRFTELGYAVVIDVETTGLDYREDRVIEVAALRLDFRMTEDDPGAGEVTSFYSRIRPDRPISAGARSVHGITDRDLQDEPPFSDVATALREFIGDRSLVGHNIGFDKKFLHEEFKRAGTPSIWKNTVYCTQKRLGYYLLFNGVGHKKPALTDALRLFSIEGRRGKLHGAGEDAFLTLKIARVLREIDGLPGDVKQRWQAYFTSRQSAESVPEDTVGA